MLKSAKYWEVQHQKTIENNSILRCLLCPHYCILRNGERGRCRKRFNYNGSLYTDTYSNITSIAIDPIEKKPLYHFYPGSHILSLGSNSCNLSCKFCQNYQISQYECQTRILSIDQLYDKVVNESITSVAFTYSEPIISIEYILDFAQKIHNSDIKLVMVSNGFVNKDALRDLSEVIDAWNIDLKAFNRDFYKEICGGSLNPVIDTIDFLSNRSHVEISYLIIPGKNDQISEAEMMFQYIRDLNPNIPLHINRYFPNFQMSIKATPLELLEELYAIASNYLNYVYIGNLQNFLYKNTACPQCKEIVIERNSYEINSKLNGSQCSNCGHEIYGVFNE